MKRGESWNDDAPLVSLGAAAAEASFPTLLTG
jgi:hypothetical protein